MQNKVDYFKAKYQIDVTENDLTTYNKNLARAIVSTVISSSIFLGLFIFILVGISWGFLIMDKYTLIPAVVVIILFGLALSDSIKKIVKVESTFVAGVKSRSNQQVPLQKTEPVVRTSDLPAKAMRRCQECDQENDITAKFCNNCGSKLETSKNQPTFKFCNSCGAENTGGGMFCSNCGKKFE